MKQRLQLTVMKLIMSQTWNTYFIINNSGDYNRSQSRDWKALRSYGVTPTKTETKVKILSSCIFPVATFKCKSRTISQSINKNIGVFELKFFWRVLITEWTERVNSADILKTWTLEKNRFINSIVSWNQTCFSSVKCHSGLARTVIEDVTL